MTLAQSIACRRVVAVSLAVSLVVSMAGCAGLWHRASGAPTLPFATDTARVDGTRNGVTHRYFHAPQGPWAIHVLEVELGKCYAAIAVKGADGAIGRKTTSTLLSAITNEHVVAGVNADFFSLTAPPGVPTGILVANGGVVTGPSEQPALVFDSAGAPHILTLRSAGTVAMGAGRYTIDAWNRPAPTGVALYDARWSLRTDTASGTIEVALNGQSPARVIAVDTLRAGIAIPLDGSVLVVGRNAPASVRASFGSLRSGDTLRAVVALTPMHPREAVGGRPWLVRDDTIPGVVDTEGQPGFATGRHPRTAAGIARTGTRLILVVVDGRQMPYSDGMTLRELATLMRALGARNAINLDGGGSTTFVYAPGDAAGALRVMNRPSDPAGERTVGDALAIVQRCGRR